MFKRSVRRGTKRPAHAYFKGSAGPYAELAEEVVYRLNQVRTKCAHRSRVKNHGNIAAQRTSWNELCCELLHTQKKKPHLKIVGEGE